MDFHRLAPITTILMILFQISKRTVLYFTEVLWPEFSIWNLLAAILHFQRHAPEIEDDPPILQRQQDFLEKIETKRWQDLEKLVGC